MTTRRAARPSILRSVPLDRHAVIEASAGTGKTFTLESLVVELVLRAEVDLERLLLVTFTEKATHELRVRVRAKLEDLVAGRAAEPDEAQIAAGDFWVVDDAARARLERALHTFDGTTIATIHAFCQRVLRENAFASSRLFEEQQVDAMDTFRRALRDVLRREVATDPERSTWLEMALRAGFSIDDIEGLVWACFQAKGDLRPVFDPRRLALAIDAFPVADARLIEGRDAMKSWGIKAQTALKLGNQLYALALLVEEARAAKSPSAFLIERSDVDFDYLVEKLSPIGPRPGPTGRACAAALELARVAPTLEAALAGAVLPAVRTELARRKRQAGQYDFDDMLLLVDEALRGPSGERLTKAMREHWSYALIDEFQDTDETQWSIFRRAFFEPGPDKSVLYLVGDPKQSIYRFRGADVQTYLRARDEVLSAGGEVLRLDRSFRASQGVVDATNAMFDVGKAGPFFSGALTYTPVSCAHPDRTLVDGQGRPVTPIHVLRCERDGGFALFGAHVARQVQTLTNPSAPWRFAGEPIEHHHVFVLTRSRAEGRAIGQALRAEGVPFAFYKEEGLFQTDEARDVRTLLAAVDKPHVASRRLAAWMTPFFDLSLESLERARELPPSHPYVARLHAWKARADDRDFEGLFESILTDSGVLRREIFFADGERELTNYTHLFELLLDYSRRTHGTIADLTNALSGFIDGTRLPLDIEGNMQRLESERRSVQIMTIHKAKGLEAPIVFMAGGWSRGGGDTARVYHEGEQRLAWVGRLSAAVKPLAVAEESEEDQRLMYVALTRAKGRVYLPCVLRDGKLGRLSGPYEAVNRRVFELAASASSLVTLEDAPRLALVSSRAPNDSRHGSWEPPLALLAPPQDKRAYDALRETRAGSAVTSYTRMKGSRSGAAASWATEPSETRAEKGSQELETVRPDSLRAARTSGVFVHEVLERVPFASFACPDFDAWRARPDIAALFDETMAVHRIDPTQRSHAERLAWSAYTTPIALPGGARLDRIASSTRAVREMDFVFPIEGTSTYVRGSIDLAFEHDGFTYFVDWKTDSLASYDEASLTPHVLAHYEQQIELYALATVKLLCIHSADEYGARFGGILYCFLRGFEGGAGLWSLRPAWDRVREWERSLTRRMAQGHRT